MKRETLKKLSLLLVAILMAIMVIFAGFSIQPITASAATSPSKTLFSGISGSPNNDDLYNETNTYKFNGKNTVLDREYVYYDTNTENNEIVSEGAPLITVLTHGLNGYASHWSNNSSSGKFAYDKDSLFARLNDELLKDGGRGANIYWAKMDSSNQFYLYDLNNKKNVNNGEYEDKETISTITDISKHIIIVFEATKGASKGYNYEVYEEFNYMLSKIVYDVKQLSGGELPRINLIGHSRGGITNLMYALDHPKMVASMFGIGTPYFGSDSASTDLGATIAGNNDGLDDIIDRSIYLKYFNLWHNNYERLYSGINGYALGGYSDLDFVFDAIIASNDSEIEDILSDSALTTIKWAIKAMPDVVRGFSDRAKILDFIISLFRDEGYEESDFESYVQLLADVQYFVKDENKNWWDNFCDNFVHNIAFLGCPYFMNDLLVDLSSQTGVDTHSEAYRSYGFNIYTKCFREDDYENGVIKKLSSPDWPAIVHNLEARDNDFINYILSRISLGQFKTGYFYSKTSETTASLWGYRGSLPTGEVEIPSQIDGLTIDRIGRDIFKGSGVGITSLVIPASVKYIEKEAFVGLSALTEVKFSADSSLISIGREAFSCCVELRSFAIPSKVTHIGYNVFLGCKKLKNLTVESGNTEYSVSDGILFNKDQTELIYFLENKNVDSYSIPSSVNEIAPYAFYGNTNLEKVYFNKSNPRIGDYAFSDCINLCEIYFYDYKTPNVGCCAFPFSGYTIYVPHSKQSDYALAFGNYSINVDSVKINVNFIDNGSIISTREAYFGETILSLPSISRKGYDFVEWNSNAAFTGITFNVGDIWDTDKELSVFARWSPKQYNITFSGYGCENLDIKTVVYDSVIGALPIIARSGYNFLGWQDEFGNYYDESTVWINDYNVVLKPDLRANQYTITFNSNGGQSNMEKQEVTYGQVITSLAHANKKGHAFLGWNTLQNGEGQSVNVSDTYMFETDIVVYAQYTAETYNVVFDKCGGDGGSNGVPATFGLPMPEGNNVTAPIRNGYVFDGYYLSLNGTSYQYYDKNMKSVRNWNVEGGATLFAKWLAKSYYVKFNKQGGENGSDGVTVTFGKEMPTGLYAPTKEGYSFQGYFSTPNGEKQYYNSNMTSANSWNIDNDSPELYARWVVQNYHIEFEKEGGTGGTTSVNVNFLANMPQATAPVRTGYDFEGYYTETNGIGTKYYNDDMTSAQAWNIPNNAKLYANWKGKNYIVELVNEKAPCFNSVLASNSASDIIYIGFIPMTSGTITFYTSHTLGDPYLYLYNSEFNVLKYDDDGYGNRDSKITFDVIKNNKYYVGFRGYGSVVTFGSVHYYGVSVSSFYGYSEVTATYGKSLPEQKIQSIAGYTFLGYYTGKDGSGQKYYDGPNMFGCKNWDITENTTLYALWKANTYDITFHSEGDKTLDIARKITYGDSLDLFAPKKSGYAFDGYYDANGKKYCEMQIVDDKQTADINALEHAYVEKVFWVNGIWDYPANITLYGRWVSTPFECDYPYWSFYGSKHIGGATAHLTHGASKISPVSIDGYKFNHFEYFGRSYSADDYIPVVLYRGLSNNIHLDGMIYAYYDEDECLAKGSLITLADGSQVAVENLKGDEWLLVWNLYTGTYDIAPILFIDKDPEALYNVINLTFSDSTVVKVISEHGFWDYDLNKYVYLDENAEKYIGHWFNKGDTRVQLTGVDIKQEYTTPYSPVTYGHLCYFVDGMLSMPGGIGGLFNIFDVDAETMSYDEASMRLDIEAYGLFTYEEFVQYLDLPEEVFEAFNGQYLKVAIGKGLISMDELSRLYNRYSKLL